MGWKGGGEGMAMLLWVGLGWDLGEVGGLWVFLCQLLWVCCGCVVGGVGGVSVMLVPGCDEGLDAM